MDSQESTRNGGPNVPTAAQAEMGASIRAQGGSIPPPPFFPSFSHIGSQIPFVYPHSFMPRPPVHGHFSDIAEISASQMRSSQDFGSNQSKSTKKRRVARKKPEIVELDDVKDEAEVLKTAGHWKDH